MTELWHTFVIVVIVGSVGFGFWLLFCALRGLWRMRQSPRLPPPSAAASRNSGRPEFYQPRSMRDMK